MIVGSQALHAHDHDIQEACLWTTNDAGITHGGRWFVANRRAEPSCHDP